MKWEGREKSRNVDDRRGKKVKIGGGVGIGTMIIIGLIYLFASNPDRLVSDLQLDKQMRGGNSQMAGARAARPDDELAEFVSVVLRETEVVWEKIFREQLGKRYQHPTLVIFDGKVQSACGFASAASGPFYCPGDQQLYIDLSFYRQLSQRFNAPGDFAMAYVVAHEVAHHVQYLLGITQQVHSQKGRISKKAYNDLSVRMELQADFLSGVWAHHAHLDSQILERGDIEEALNAASQIGDDKIQKQTQGYIVPDSFTHGSSEQRQRWFKKGITTGDINQGDTFGASYL